MLRLDRRLPMESADKLKGFQAYPASHLVFWFNPSRTGELNTSHFARASIGGALRMKLESQSFADLFPNLIPDHFGNCF